MERTRAVPRAEERPFDLAPETDGRLAPGVAVQASPEAVPHEAALSEAEAQQVWRTAARLQAEAARRLDERSQHLAEDAAAAGALAAPAQFTRGEVEHIAESAGIDPAFVALAWREVEADRLRPATLTDARHARASAFLGTDAERLSVTRTFDAPPEAVLAAMERVLPGDPYRLVLAEIVGDAETLADATLLFDVPQLTMQVTETGGYTAFSHAMTIADLTRAAVTLHPLGDGRTEATVVVDLRYGKVRNAVFGGWFTGGMADALGFGGGVLGLAVGDGGATAIALGAALGATGSAAVTYAGFRAAYASGLRKGEKALVGMLQAVGVDLRAGGAFARRPSPPRASRPDDDATMMILLGGA